MNRLKKIIEAMDYSDLKAIQKDMAEGNIGMLIKKRIEDIEGELDQKICPVCGRKLSREEIKYSIEFGDEFKKRANFCGIDCMRFFVEKIEREKKRILKY